MSLDDFAPEPPPKGWEPYSEHTGQIGSAIVKLPRPDVTRRDLLVAAGFNPDEWAIKGDIQVRRWMRTDQEWLYYNKFEVTAGTETDDQRQGDIEALTAMIRGPRIRRATPTPAGADAWLYVASDWQIGKGEGDGTKGTVDRVLASIEQAVTQVGNLRRIGRAMPTGCIAGTGDLGEGTCGFFCVAAETPVLTDDLRWIPAGDLRVGDGLYALEDEPQARKSRRYQFANVTHHQIRELPSVRVTFSNGDTMVCTSEHPFLARPIRGNGGTAAYRWVQAKDLQAHHEVAKQFDVWQFGRTHDHGWLAGLYDGEGYFSPKAARSAPHTLSLHQMPGVVLDRARELLSRFGFAFTESKHPDSGVVNLRIQGGYAETLRALGTLRPERLLNKLGTPTMWTTSSPSVIAVEDAGIQRIAIMGTSSHTYFAGGYAVHNSNQPFVTDCNRREQNKITRSLLTYAIDELAPLFDEFIALSVAGNHGENRNDGRKATDDADNDDVAQMECVKEAYDKAGKNNITWMIPHDEMSILAHLGGVPVGFTHGHLFTGGGKMAQAKALEWWKGQVFGLQAVAEAKLLISSHFHHFSVINHGSRSHLQSPAMDPGSRWVTNAWGSDSPAGVLTLRIDANEPMGFADLQVLGGRTTSA